MMQFDHFSMIAGIFNKLERFNPSPILIDLISLSAYTNLLDIGGGTGRVANVFREKVNSTIVADISHGMLVYAVRKGLQTVCTPAEFLPFPSNSFDRIIIVDALHHVNDQKLTITELGRVLVPGGYLILVEPDIHRFLIKLIALAEKILLMRSHFLDEEGITALFNSQFINTRSFHDGLSLYIRTEKVR
jgi:ubiquinone/menaquinone biosynthesis C-methylase UbiE